GTLVARERVVLRAADRAEENRVGVFRELERGRRQRIAVRVVRNAADERFLGLDRVTFAPQRIEDANGFLQDFGPDAIAREQGDLHWKIQGSCCLRFSSNALISLAW